MLSVWCMGSACGAAWAMPSRQFLRECSDKNRINNKNEFTNSILPCSSQKIQSFSMANFGPFSKKTDRAIVIYFAT
ncbi:hypothetical protein BD769DRAFT_1473195 [Suillus cothurnatus]|nr:hypothetical protein BD769DRAFT_1473195 [Suillus cothurnatus]